MTPELFEKRIACFINKIKISKFKISQYYFGVSMDRKTNGAVIYTSGLFTFIHPLDMFLMGKPRINEIWSDMSRYSGVSIENIVSFFAGFCPPEYAGLHIAPNKEFKQIGERLAKSI